MIVAALLAASSNLAVLLVADAADGAPPPRPLDARASENLAAFARLYGLVRFFHPSDEAAAADWASVAIEGARLVEDAPDGDALRARLDAIFLPLAPSMVLRGGGPRAAESP